MSYAQAALAGKAAGRYNGGMKSLPELIKEKKLDWVNDDITADNFPPQEVRKGLKLFTFNRYISSEDVVKEMEREGYTPANVYELLSWKEWDGSQWVAALGQSAGVNRVRCVSCLYGSGAPRRLSLGDWARGWYGDCAFLGAQQDSGTKKSELTLSLELRIAKLEADVKKLLAVINTERL